MGQPLVRIQINERVDPGHQIVDVRKGRGQERHPHAFPCGRLRRTTQGGAGEEGAAQGVGQGIHRSTLGGRSGVAEPGWRIEPRCLLYIIFMAA